MFHEVMEYYRIPLYILFGILPSVAWLFYYLKKDLHPEPKRMIIKIFLMGSVITVPVLLIQIGLSLALHQLQNGEFFSQHFIILAIVKWFIVIAFTEELLKYLIVKVNIFDNYALDEPLDIMLYMMVAALGFAAVENILYLFSPLDVSSFDMLIKTTITISFIRFVGATLLHALCSGLTGYFIALSFLDPKKKVLLSIGGLGIATFLHGLYDFSIATLIYPINFLIPSMILFGLLLFIITAFDKVKKMKSICKI
ncbi:MAG: hypothetical protein A2908_01985 [Candidatus Staskawiczbacteria bacterium RIFCSPLOWO2_01_FULL_38_12b]|uniref:Protease PrsW n=1 Tax=Candidatus Staskawiczbacteria bacterium RIFCSPLOWO2_01_FULL_38_12b TaxID=1802214 RepID=A0A1G2IEE2_9BACT|nr:MAG: hypothetical protein A2908_01985 [Candidatus Staskawiczbacteria bacterium RIFCSPLOWO2_01_FULL_38_12b]QBM02624.1 protease PrsW [uncultured archaeon]